MRAYRAAIFHLLEEPASGRTPAHAYHPDGLLLVEDDRIAACGDFEALKDQLGAAPVEAFPGRLITPGFIDLHIHFPQLEAIAAYGEQLLDWLDRYIYPAEAAFADPAHAAAAASAFLDALLRHGTTTALVFGSSHKASVEALFTEALGRNMRLIAGKVLMDRGAPDALLDGRDGGRRDTLDLIADWNGKGRLGYAVTPRFALTSSPAQLAMAGEILADHPDVWLQTHLAESPAEIAAVGGLFPDAGDYLAVYEAAGLVRRRSVFAHCVHLDNAGFARLAGADAAVAFCPASNLFLGSGLFPLRAALTEGVKVGIGTDVGAGTSVSVLANLGEAYKVGQLQHQPLDPLQAFYLATLGGARALDLDDRIGNLAPGKEADFLVLDLAATPVLAARTGAAASLEERLFALMILGDDRVVEQTYVAGVRRHSRGR